MGRRADSGQQDPGEAKSQKAQSLTRAGVMPIFRGSRRARLRLAGFGTEMKSPALEEDDDRRGRRRTGRRP